MSTSIEVPNMGESITEGVIAQWLVSDGDYVKEGDPLFELETDKISTEVPAPATGAVHITTGDGETVAIGSSVGSVDTAAREPTGDELPEPGGATDPEAHQASDDAEDNVAEEPDPEPDTITRPEDRSAATPAARALMQEHRISPDAISGTGAKGHITKGDVLAFIERKPEARPPDRPTGKPQAPARRQPAAAPDPEPTSDATINAGERRERMSPLRQRIATRLVQAQHTAAILTTFNEIDMAPCMALRKRFKERFAEKHAVGLGFMSFFGKAVCEALADFPMINARIEGTEIVHPEHVNLGIAVGTDKGLVVPVLRGAEDLSFADIERGIKDFAGRARSGKLTIPDMEGGTFTITNGGVYGSLLSTPIINPPQSGILGMHTIKERPVALDGAVVIRPMMYVALSYDHRIVDGAGAVGFLVRIKELIEEPERLLFDL